MLDKNYEAEKVEKKWQDYWEKKKIYKYDPKRKKKSFSIDVPPPYASSGHLHVGHALHYTQFELIARYKRMKGFNVYFAPCFDNNGLPTEKYVEEKFNISKGDMPRDKFRKLCLEESKKVEEDYVDKVFKKLGHSYDWDLLYTTISKEAQKVSQTSFLELAKKKLAYRSEEPVIWCTYHKTALAQAEIEDKERNTKLNYVYFDLEKGGKIEIATTRPELLAACVGIFVHPEDKKYAKLVGKNAIVPLFGHKVKIRTDDKVDMKFGSGIVMVCTFGDKTDVEWWKKHKLDLRNVITEEGKLNEKAGKYKGLNFKEAREKIIHDLKKENKLIKQEDLRQVVGCCWRCSTPVEFYVTKQWFIKTLDFKKELIKQGKKINWWPKFYRVRFEDWTKNLGWDWCISRQRYYGVPIPVWYCKNCGNAILPEEKDLPIDPTIDKPKKKCKCGSKEFVADEDVLDTWMTSSMTPQIAGRWLEKPKKFKKIYPFNLRPQSHDIIRTWAFYTILKSYLHFKKIPWKDISIGTYILDSKGRGMHKSKGNAIWADDLLKKYNVDVFRYWVGTAKWGEDLPFQEKDLVAGSRFLTKLWNASRFSLMHLKDYKSKGKLEGFDKWLLLKLNKVIEEATKSFDNYDTSEAKKVVEQFFWHDFCDNYLEIVKDRLYNPDKRGKESREGAQYCLFNSLLSVLKMIAPIMPHVSEEIYQNYFAKKEKKKSIHVSDWPKKFNVKGDLKSGEKAIEIISKVRQFKTKHNKSLKEKVNLVLDKKLEKDLKVFLKDLKAVCNADIEFGIKFKISFI